MAKDSEKIITVKLDGEDKKIADGSYTMEELVEKLGAQTGYVLSVRHGEGKLEPMIPGESVKIHPNMQFISQPPDGNWS